MECRKDPRYHQCAAMFCAAVRRRIADDQDNGILDSLASAYADAKLRTIYGDMQELLNFMDAIEDE